MRTFISLCILLFCVVLAASNCRKNKPTTATEQLPPETQTGANTFGCLIDGQVFTAKGDPLSGPITKAQYQFLNGKYRFSGAEAKSKIMEALN